MSSSPREENRVPGLVAKSDADNTPVIVEADAATKRLKVTAVITSGGGGGTQYTDGDAAVTHPIGTIPVYNNAGTITAVSVANPLPVSATISTVGLATSVKQSDGSQKTQIVDSTGNVIGATSNALDINIKSGNPTSITANAGTNLNTSALALDSTLTGGTQQTKLTDGTNIANILKSDGTAAGQNAELVSGTGMTTATVTLNIGSPTTTWYDLLNYPWISLEILTNTAPSTLTFQTSGDASQTNIRSMVLQDSQSMANLGALTSASTVASLHGPRAGRYFRISSNVSGVNTVTLVLTFYTTASALQTLGVQATQSGTWTVGSNSATGSAVPANAFYNGISDGTNLRGVLGAANALNSTGAGVPVAQIVGQFDDVSPTAITENQFGNIRMSTNRNLYGTIRDAAGNERGANVTASNELVVSDSGLRPAGTSLIPYSVHLTTNTTTTPTASTAYISSIAISSEVAGTTSTVTIQDKSGTPLKLINGFSTTALTTTPTVVNFQTPVKMVSGIDIVTAGAVAATIDVWINYYQ